MNRFKMKSRVVVKNLASGEVIIRNAPRRDDRVRLSEKAELILFAAFIFVCGMACGVYLASASASAMISELAK